MSKVVSGETTDRERRRDFFENVCPALRQIGGR